MKDKTKASVILEPWVRETIDSREVPRQTYGGWIRQLVEDWAKSVGD